MSTWPARRATWSTGIQAIEKPWKRTRARKRASIRPRRDPPGRSKVLLLLWLLQAQATASQEPEPPVKIEEHVTVSSTRTDRGLEDQPMRVEVLDAEEIDEKLMMTPGDVVMMLNEMGGMRVQASSPSLGAASVRIQGMRGRYTRFLSD